MTHAAFGAGRDEGDLSGQEHDIPKLLHAATFNEDWTPRQAGQSTDCYGQKETQGQLKSMCRVPEFTPSSD